MLTRVKTFRIEANDLKAPPYVHRYTVNGKNGWRIQPTGYMKEFTDDEFGGPVQSLEVAIAAIRVISKMTDSSLLQIFNPVIRASIRMNGEMQLVMILPKGMQSKQPVELKDTIRLGGQTIRTLGEPWVGLKVYEFLINEAPIWFPISSRSQAFQKWKQHLLQCVQESMKHS